MKIKSLQVNLMYSADIEICLDESSPDYDHLSLNTDSECCKLFTEGYARALQESLKTPKSMDSHKEFTLNAAVSAVLKSGLRPNMEISDILSEIGYSDPEAVRHRNAIYNQIARLGLTVLARAE